LRERKDYDRLLDPAVLYSLHVKDDTARKLIPSLPFRRAFSVCDLAVRCGGPDMFPVFLTGPTAGISDVRNVASQCCAQPSGRAFNAADVSAAAVAGSVSIPALRMPQDSSGVSIARHPA
jgi:hypothetical protein